MKTFDPSGFTILIVDDILKNIQVLGSFLRDSHYGVEYSTNGRETLKLIEKQHFDLMLLDIMMPGMTGKEVCQKIRENPEYDDMPIIFLTAKTERENILEGFASGGQDYITKPFDGPELLARVRTQLELKSLRDEQKKVNQWLEEKVKERTLELQEAYDKLEKANLELQNLDVAKGEFLNLISHEIRTPLNGILGFTRLLKEELKSSEVYTMIHYLDISASRLEKFSLIALQITELKTRNRPIASENIPVNRLIEHAFEAVREKIQTKGVTVETEGNVNKIKIPGEKKLLDICFESLLDNAVKYSDQGGLVIIRIGTDKQGVHCEFIDEGCGFSAEALKNLYQFFGLGEQHIDQNVGLDLALVKMIMDAHQGKIEIRNNESRGATVRLVFE